MAIFDIILLEVETEMFKKMRIGCIIKPHLYLGEQL